MATLTAKPPTNADVPPKEVLQELRMPPFPKPPTGAKIIPFNEFKPSGIRVSVDELGEEIEPDDETPERDALGIPTIILNVKHTMDTTEKVKRRKKRKLPVVMTAEQAKHKTWWEDWEETERYRQNAHDQKFSPADRLVQAAEDFARGRTMPVTVSGFWDQFRLYTGLLVNPNQAAANDDDEDEDEEEAVPGEESATLGEPPGPRIVEVEVSGARSTSQDTKSKMDTAALLKEDLWADLGSPIAERFLDDPELSIKIFFSSYFRKKGLLYNPLRCVALPILIHFFLRYLVRCKTFQESHLDASIRRALAIAELAKVQLPATSKIGLKLPDEFSGGCGAIWGLKHPLWERTSRPQQDPALAQDVEGQERAQAEIRKRVEEERARREAEDEERFRAEEEERAAKRQKVASEFESEIKAVEASMAASEPISAGWGETDTTAEGIKAGVSSTDDQPTVNPGGWSTNNGGWDTSTTTGGGWGDSNSTWDMTDVDQKLADAEQAARWHLPDHSLLPLLGPTAFPLTHRTGIVEKSMRRIVEVISPTAGRACRIASGPSAEAVEEELTRRLARIVLEPWPRANLAPDTEINEPTILPSSLGKVNLEAVEGVEGHAPSRDKITLLVEPAVAQLFEPTLLGMGLFATWIQLVRREKEGDKGKTKPRDEFWYMEELLWQIPSYYTDLPEGENEK